jgi:hypothetical protein
VGTEHGAAAQATPLQKPLRRQPITTFARSSEPVEPAAPPLSTGGTSLLQARTVNEVVKAQTNKVRLAQAQG